jgi:hypothetical protein
MRRLIALILLLPFALLAIVFPLTAQDAPPLFATNTPPVDLPAAPGMPAMATNTPVPTLRPVFRPDAPFEQYALRRWDENTFVGLILDQVQQLQDGDTARALGIRLLQNELARRFPGAPHDPAAREALLSAMLNAPRGMLDLRPVVRPTIETALNQMQVTFDQQNSLEANGFALTILPANFDGQGAGDAVIRTTYPVGAQDSAALFYSDYTIATVGTDGRIHLVSAAPNFPAAPLDDVEAVWFEGVRDVNGDGLDELAVSQTITGEINTDLFIYGWRNGSAVGLAAPGQTIHFHDALVWPPASQPLVVSENRVESAAWNCLADRPVTWTWSSNFYRAPETLAEFVPQNTLGCQLYASEPLLSMPPAAAQALIEQLLPQADQNDSIAAVRAAMLIAMLKVFQGDINGAQTQVNLLAEMAPPDSWAAAQAKAFQDGIRQSNSTPLSLCAALQNATPQGACDVDAVLARVFADQPLRRDESLDAQAARLGLTVQAQVTITEVGHLDRQAIHFDLSAPDAWWAFAPLADDVYTAERISPPPAFTATATPITRLETPRAAFDALLAEDNPQQALAIINTAISTHSTAPLVSSGRYVQAVSYEATGDRDNARRAYFSLWQDEPESVWGALAAAHLEKR